MFNSDDLTKRTVTAVMDHVYWKGLQALMFAPSNIAQMAAESGMPHPLQQSPLGEQITLLCRVANGEIDRQTADDLLVGEIMETCQSVAEILWSNPMAGSYSIPSDFWKTELGQVIAQSQLWCSGDELITISAAAELAYGENNQKNRMRIQRLMNKGDLQTYIDPHESNEQHNKRLSKLQVEEIE